MQQLEGYFEAISDSRDMFHVWRKRSWDRFLQFGLPKPKQEAFQYISFKDVHFPKPAEGPSEESICRSHSLVFSNGFFQSADLPKPLVCLKLNAAMLVYGVFLQSRLNKQLSEETDPFALLNGAFSCGGAFLYVPPDIHIEQPIEILHQVTSNEMVFPRLQIFLGKGASVRIVQRILGEKNPCFCSAYMDCSLDAGASLFLGDLQQHIGSARALSAFRFTLKRDSRLHFLSLTHGSQLMRSSIKTQLLEDNSEALLQGLWQLDADLNCHTHVLVEHAAPYCRSKQHFKGMLKGNSRSSFEGNILVRAAGQKTEAYQLNNNLLLSDDATAFSKPNLEIFADDVKASHGATVSRLNEEMLFYLRSRGMSFQAASEALASGFCEEILKAVPPQVSLEEFLPVCKFWGG